MTALYQTDAPASTMTSPIRVAVGATKASAAICGRRPSKENDGIRRGSSQVGAGHVERGVGIGAFGAQGVGIAAREPPDEEPAELAGVAGDPGGCVGRSVGPGDVVGSAELDAWQGSRGLS